MKRLTNAEFLSRLLIARAGRVTAVEPYVHMFSEIGFVCDKGHSFKTTPASMLKSYVKYGCPECGCLSAHLSQTKTQSQLIEDVKAIHGVSIWPTGIYSGRNNKILWECENGHQFMATPATILMGSKCQQCIGRAVNNHEQYIAEIQRRFRGRVWPTVQYVNSATKISHQCGKGHDFVISPNQVLDSVFGGCAACAGMKKRDNEGYDQQVEAAHGGRVIRVGDYINGKTPITHRCDKGHEWKASPTSILWQETACPECAHYGFKANIPAFLYYLRIIERTIGNHYFKIGITNRSVSDRVKQMVCDGVVIEVINSRRFSTGSEAYLEEQRILLEFSKYLVPNCTLLRNGNSEVFTRDIMSLLESASLFVTPKGT